MPLEWGTGQIITIHKKGSQQECSNYRGITLLPTAYKILSKIIQRRLKDALDNKIGDYQCGFSRGKSTVDAIHTVKRIIEKAHQYQISLELLFVDFKQAFDSLNRNKIILIMEEMKIPSKIIRLVAMTLSKTKACVKTNKGKTEEFVTNKGVRRAIGNYF